ncbi:glycosyltransferase family 2 protein [Roseivirga sp.]|uniref:glycosyltransferase family 2 protein n=1 Tax=Roseivirga sp. TaxID=1964215 RepID=UPI003B517E1B
MKFSLITVCLNSKLTITDTIESVISQSYGDYEHIVFDGGSTDGTIEILKSYGDKIRLIQGNDSGIFDAMNQAITHASGEIIGIINSDDFYAHSEVLSRVSEVFNSTGVDSIYGDLHYVYRNDTSRIYRNWRSGEFNLKNFRYGWTIPHPTFFVRHEIYIQYGLFDDQFRISGDYELILRFLYKHRISTCYIPEVLVKMRNGGNSDGGIYQRYKSLREDYCAWKRNRLQPGILTIPLKPLTKIRQFFG